MCNHLLLLLILLCTTNFPTQGQKRCKGVCKWGKCNKDNCIKEARCVWNSGSCKGEPECAPACRSKVCQGCDLPSVCNGKIIDVAVIGAGVSGIHSAFRLAQKYDWSIKVFDTNDRIGGRTFSLPMPGITDFKADFGAMRFNKKRHPRLLKLAGELGLTTQLFTTPTVDDTLFYLREELLDKTDIDNGNVPFKMTDTERKLSGNTNALRAYWNNMIIANDSKSLKDPWDKVCVDGKMAYEKGNHNAWLEVTSKDVIDYVTFRLIFTTAVLSNINYATWSNTEYTPRDDGPPSQMYTFREGFQELTLNMARRFVRKRNNKILLNHELQSVSHNGSIAVLNFTNKVKSGAVNVCAREVILGLSAESVKRIEFLDDDISHTLTELLPAVIRQPATKVYLVYDNPWWRKFGKGPKFKKIRNSGNDIKFIVTDLPLGQVLDIGVDEKTGNAMLLIYNDWWERVQFWSPYMLYGIKDSSGVPAEFVSTEKLVRAVNIQLAKIFNVDIDQIPLPKSTAVHAWYDKPYFTGWHSKSPGFRYPTVQMKILKPVVNKGVYIVGEAFSDFHGWVEGALQTSQEMLSEYFNLSF